MAFQVAHIVYAKKYFEALERGKGEDFLDSSRVLNPPEKLDKDQFILGAVFPDIRRVDETIRRKDTHLYFKSVDLDFSGLTSFEAGWKFHLYCDMRREEILNKYNFYVLKNAADFFNNPAKFLEDELVYEKYNNWEKIIGYFNNPPFPELKINVTRETFTFWYAIIAKYLEEKPTTKSMRVFMSKTLSLRNKTEAIAGMIDELRKDKKVVAILEKVLEEIV